MLRADEMLAATFLRFIPGIDMDMLLELSEHNGQFEAHDYQIDLYSHLCRMYREASGGASNPEIMRRLVDLIEATDAPYFLRYMVSRDFLRTPFQFERWARALQGERIKLSFGGTQEQRYAAIEPYFTGDGSAFVDIGCGKGYYLERLAPRYTSSLGFEAHTPTRIVAEETLADNGIETVSIEGVFRNQILPEFSDVLLTEVVEHIPYQAALDTVRTISSQQPRLFVITAPNREFNCNYQLEQDFRHRDHKWEPTRAEFVVFVQSATADYTGSVSFKSVGDKVDGVPTSLMAVLQQ